MGVEGSCFRIDELGEESETLSESVEWIAFAGILLDDEPLACGIFGGGDNGRKIEVSLAEGSKIRFVFGVDAVVFEMDEGDSVVEALGPEDRIAATALDPVNIEFHEEVLRVDGVEDGIENRASFKATEFVMVIVVSEGKAGIGAGLTGGAESLDKGEDRMRAGEVDTVGERVDEVRGTKGLENRDMASGILKEGAAGPVDGGNGEAEAVSELADLLWRGVLRDAT